MPTEAFDLLSSVPETESLPPVVVLFGDDATVRGWVLAALTSGGDAESLEGETAVWRDVYDEVSTMSLFDAGRRTVVIRRADPMLKKYRGEIENYLAKPSSAGRLFLELASLPSNTRLYKAADKQHLLVHCAAPRSGRSKNPDRSRLAKFLGSHVAPRHRCKMSVAAANTLIDLLGTDLGMLDTEIAKLALYAAPGAAISESQVREIVGGWKARSTWETIDAAASGNTAEALRQLDRMLAAGEDPRGLMPQFAWSLRRMAMATAAVEYGEQTGQRIPLTAALKAAGYREFELEKVKGHLVRLGRKRARLLLHWLLDADLKLKGSHSGKDLDRMALEQFVLKLANLSAQTP